MRFVEETLLIGEDLLKCMRAALGTSGLEELTFAPDQWRRIADLAANSGVSPILFRSLPIADSSLGIPKDIGSRWLVEYLVSTAWNNKLVQHLDRILLALNREGIPVILLKGIHLMDALYAERGMRLVGDIDILVDPDNCAASERIVGELGYVVPRSLIGLPVWHPYHRQFVHPKTKVAVEIHSNIADSGSPLGMEIGGLWQRSLPAACEGAKVLAPADLIAHLSLHLAYHLLSAGLFGAALRSLYDIALLIRMDWAREDLARISGILRNPQARECFAISIALAEKLLHAPLATGPAFEGVTERVPPAVLNTLKTHILLSCNWRRLDEKMPQFIRTSIMAERSNSLSGFMKRVFLTREEWLHRYGVSNNVAERLLQYGSHIKYLLKAHLHPRRWGLGWDTLALKAHYGKVAEFRDSIHLK